MPYKHTNKSDMADRQTYTGWQTTILLQYEAHEADPAVEEHSQTMGFRS